MTTNATSSTLADWLAAAVQTLKSTGIATARLDCLVLLEDALGKDRTHLLAHQELTLNSEQISLLNSQITRRALHEPLAYIRGKTEFYGREFMVSPDTLEPRPETETMIDLLKQLADSKQLTVDSNTLIADIGTGSGCLAITTKLEFPRAKVCATDISKKCLEIARKNAQKHGVPIEFIEADLLSAVNRQPSAVLANLPYVPDGHTINQAAMQEPKLAIFGGSDGLDIYRQLFSQLVKLKPKYVLTESLPFQHAALAKIARAAGYKLQNTTDFIQIFSR